MTASPFTSLGVPAELVRILDAQGITEPFPIQAATLPDALAGRDVLGQGRTGSGKTLAFALPIVARLGAAPQAPMRGRPRALVVVPTRELATQVAAVIEPLAAGATAATRRPCSAASATARSATALASGVEILIACPGRLLDLMKTGRRAPRQGRGVRSRRGRPHGRPGLPSDGQDDPRRDAAPTASGCCSRPRWPAASTRSCRATCTTPCRTPPAWRPPSCSSTACSSSSRTTASMRSPRWRGPGAWSSSRAPSTALASWPASSRLPASGRSTCTATSRRTPASGTSPRSPTARDRTGGHGHRRPWHPRRRRSARRPRRPAGRAQGLRAPVRPHGTRRSGGAGRHHRDARPGGRGALAAQQGGRRCHVGGHPCGCTDRADRAPKRPGAPKAARASGTSSRAMTRPTSRSASAGSGRHQVEHPRVVAPQPCRGCRALQLSAITGAWASSRRPSVSSGAAGRPARAVRVAAATRPTRRRSRVPPSASTATSTPPRAQLAHSPRRRLRGADRSSTRRRRSGAPAERPA